MLEIKKKLNNFFDEKNSRLLKFFVFLFLVNFFVINWNDFSWVFNYNFLGRGLASIIDNSQKTVVQADFNPPESSPASTPKQKNSFDFYTQGQNTIAIPKLKVVAPIVVAKEETEKGFQEALKRGVLVYPGSVAPGEKGIITILGHSASPDWPKIYYDWVFSRLNELESGDEIYIISQNSRYVYKVTQKIFIEKGEEPPESLTSSDSVIYLISCWPPGKNIQRIAVKAVFGS
jgi:LPXTG-site transpeptidase (sortase) family protein